MQATIGLPTPAHEVLAFALSPHLSACTAWLFTRMISGVWCCSDMTDVALDLFVQHLLLPHQEVALHILHWCQDPQWGQERVRGESLPCKVTALQLQTLLSD
jgi:hypothetical protein